MSWTNDIVLAVKREWLDLILTGKKTAELRRCVPDWEFVSGMPAYKIFFYHKGLIYGEAFVERVARVSIFSADVMKVCGVYASRTQVPARQAHDYLLGGNSPGIILFDRLKVYPTPRRWHGPRPQNFVYVKGSQFGEKYADRTPRAMGEDVCQFCDPKERRAR